MKTIGETLRNARLEKGYTLEELQKMTKIQARYLEALEEDRFDRLPGTYYARNFIRQYAQVVDEDENYLLNLFDGGAPKPTIEAESIGSRATKNQRKKSILALSSWNWPMILLSLASLLIVGIVFWLTLRENTPTKHIKDNDNVAIEGSFTSTSEATSSSNTSEETNESISSSEEEVEEMGIAIGEETGNTVPVTLTNAQEPITLSFIGETGRCWIGIKVNGQDVFGETLEQNQTTTFTLPEATTTATITLGDSRVVSVAANEEAITFNQTASNLVLRNLNLTIDYADTDNVE